MTQEIQVIDTHAVAAQKPSIFSGDPEQQVAHAVKIANSLKKIITDQKLAIKFGGDQEYLPVEVWQTLGMFLGILPKENSVKRLKGGAYKASVDLVRVSDGVIVGGASAICGMDESWGKRPAFARRSMSITRATGKAYRTAFSWVMVLAGYQPSPAEDMPQYTPEKDDEISGGKEAYEKIKRDSVSAEIYTGTTDQQKKIQEHCEREKIDEKYWGNIDLNLMNKPFTKINVGVAIKQAIGAHQ